MNDATSPDQTESLNAQPNRPAKLDRPTRHLLQVCAAIFAAETTIMMFLLDLLPPLGKIPSALADSSLLLALLAPSLYWFLFKPLQREIVKREATARELSRAITESCG